MECTANSCCLPPLIPVLPGIDIPPTPRPIIEPLLHVHRESSIPDSLLLPEEDGTSASNTDDLTATEETTGPINSSIVSLPESELPVEEEYLVDDRLQFLFDDPFLLQDAVFKEKGLASSYVLDLKMYQTSQRFFQVITVERLRRIYQSGLLSIRFANNALQILVTSPNDTSRFDSSSVEISQIQSDRRTDVPSIVTDLLSALDVSEDSIRYIYLLYDVVNDYWELIGVLDSSPIDAAAHNSKTTTENLPTEETEVSGSNCSGDLPQPGEKTKNLKKKKLEKDCMADGGKSQKQDPIVFLSPNTQPQAEVNVLTALIIFTGTLVKFVSNRVESTTHRHNIPHSFA